LVKAKAKAKADARVNVARTRFLLKTAATVLVAAGVCAVGAAVLMPLDEPLADASSQQATPSLASANGDAVPLASLASAWSQDLRRPLTDTPGVVPQQQQVPAAVLPVRLVGTIFDPARPRGIFVTVRGQMELRGAGEKAGGVDVLSVDERGATISVAGKPVSLKVEKLETPAPAAIGPNDPPPASSARSDVKPEEGVVR
jgi:hypothetical protein